MPLFSCRDTPVPAALLLALAAASCGRPPADAKSGDGGRAAAPLEVRTAKVESGSFPRDDR